MREPNTMFSKCFALLLAAICALTWARTTKAEDAPKKDEPTVTAGPNANMLTDEEKKNGWKLLFDGKALDGWHNFKKTDIKPGWAVKEGTLSCVDPKNAGDLCTAD